ncbi:MAG: Clp protease N-terminal domain-containing protein [Mycobacteriales bacterium]
MPKINVYLPTWLAQAVKESAVPVSAVCQTALTEALQPRDELREFDRTGTAAVHDLEGVLTNRARVALHEARRRSEDVRASGPGGLELLAGLVAEGGNLALVVLASLGVTPQRLSEALSRDDRHRARTAAGAHDLGWYVERAAGVAADLGNRHVGCEHLLLAIADDPGGPAARLLADLGADAATVTGATRAGAAAAAYGRAHAGVGGLGSALSATLEEIRTRLGRLEQRP